MFAIYCTPKLTPSCGLLLIVSMTGLHAALVLFLLAKQALQLLDMEESMPQAVVASTCMHPAAPVGLVLQSRPPPDSLSAILRALSQFTDVISAHAASICAAICGLLILVPEPLVDTSLASTQSSGLLGFSQYPPSSVVYV